jgi:hypothetical protein
MNSMKNTLATVLSNKLVLFSIIFSIAAIVGRFVVHLPNFTPIGALALFAGFYLPRRYALVLPLAVMFVCDLFIGFYNPLVMLVVYTSFAAVTYLAGMISTKKDAFVIGGATLAGSLFFFLTTNVAVWAFTDYYAHSVAGLLSCLAMGLPFLKYAMVGDIFWSTVFFGSYAYFVLRQPRAALGAPQLVSVKM